MDVIFLGTGTSQGVPLIACDCAICRSPDPRDKRGRASIHVVMDGLHIQVDAAPEFRLQCVREGVTKMDLFILTHGHNDHVAGMDDLRRFCDLLGGDGMTVYTTEPAMERVIAMYPYAIMERPVVKGYPAFKLKAMPERLELPQGIIESALLPHGAVNTLGLVFTERRTGRKFSYFTDCKLVTPEARALAAGSEVVVLDGLRPLSHPTHMSIGEAVQTAAEMAAPLTYLTHLTHLTGHEATEATLPATVRIAYDGLRLKL
ncbi:MBL fold metallo-hydrolase [Nibricoccus sp. IMCC34717]|uniref:MBL fold metallo-hydrolase n=1 Tax=Nibricoccus sp. IMCC34717 TaxID=3034021 RepID=UPI0038503E44